MQCPNTISVSVRNLQRFYQIQINVDGLLRNENVVGLKTDSSMWKVRLLVIHFVTYLSFQWDT